MKLMNIIRSLNIATKGNWDLLILKNSLAVFSPCSFWPNIMRAKLLLQVQTRVLVYETENLIANTLGGRDHKLFDILTS